MKKPIYIAIVVMLTFCASAQEIKIKKGEVLLDGIPIAKMDSKLREYKITNLDGSASVVAYMRVCKAPGSEVSSAYMELASETSSKHNDMLFDKLSAFSVDKSVVKTLFAKGMMSEKGLDIDKINEFLNGEPADLPIARICKGVSNDAKIADGFQLVIDDNGTIFSKNASIGNIKMILTNGNTGGIDRYEVTDLDGKLIARWFPKSGMVSGYDKLLNQQLITFDNKVFNAEFDNRGNPIGYQMSKDITAMNIIRVLVANGYTLGHL